MRIGDVVEKWILGKGVGSFVVLGCGVGIANRLNGKSGATTVYYQALHKGFPTGYGLNLVEKEIDLFGLFLFGVEGVIRLKDKVQILALHPDADRGLARHRCQPHATRYSRCQRHFLEVQEYFLEDVDHASPARFAFD